MAFSGHRQHEPFTNTHSRFLYTRMPSPLGIEEYRALSRIFHRTATLY